MEPKDKANELINEFNYQCRECGDIDKAKIIAKKCVEIQIKELNDLANYIQNTNNDNAWVFVNIIDYKTTYLERVLIELE